MLRPIDFAAGALRLLAEARPAARVRVARSEMEGKLVKEMSEAAILEQLERDLGEVDRA